MNTAFISSEISSSVWHVVEILVKGGYETYIVGGGVRDLMLGLHPKDFDIATPAPTGKKLFDCCRIVDRMRSSPEQSRISRAWGGSHRVAAISGLLPKPIWTRKPTPSRRVF